MAPLIHQPPMPLLVLCNFLSSDNTSSKNGGKNSGRPMQDHLSVEHALIDSVNMKRTQTYVDMHVESRVGW